MHDIDRVRLEAESENEAFESGQFALNESGEVFGETENMELASELLEVSNEAELENFLGDLVAKAGQSLGQFVGSPEGKALVGVLKGAAKKVLPTLGASAGRFFGGDTGAAIGAQAASAAGRAFGLELEGLSNEDREFEVARRYVNFAGEAVRHLAEQAAQNEFETDGGTSINGALAGGNGSPKAAMDAALAAARTHAPGLAMVRATMSATPGSPRPAGHGASGRWIRQGSKIILLGV